MNGANVASELDLLPDAVLVIDVEGGRIRDANELAASIYGMSREALVGLSVAEISIAAVDDGPGESAAAPLRRFTVEHKRSDGTVFPVEVSARRTLLGKDDCELWIVRPASRNTKMDEALRESEGRFREAFEQALMGVAHLGLDGRFLRVNRTLCTMLGYSREELLERRFHDLTHPDDIEQDATALRMFAAGKLLHYSREKRYLRKDRSVVWIGLTAALVRAENGEPLYFSSFLEDISRRRRVEEELTLLKTSIDRAPHAAYWFDPEGRFVYVNDAGCRALGYTRDEMLRMRVDDVNPRATPLSWGESFRILREQGRFTAESEHLRKDGAVFPVEIVASYFKHGDREYSVGFAVDVSERQKAQKERDSLEAQLIRAQKLESIGRLAGGVAHDFSNLLTVIEMGVQQALDRVNADDPLYADLSEIRHAASRSSSLTKQLLAFARKQTIAPRVLSVNETLRDIIRMLGRLLGDSLELVFRTGEGVWPILMDPSQLDQVLANLCVNSRDAIHDIGRVTITTQNRTFDERDAVSSPGSVPGDFVEIEVSDTGCGMDPEALAHIFEPFFTTKADSAGLGLATVYGIVRQNHGLVSVRSEKGKGTTVTLHFPRHVADPKPEPASRMETPRSGKRTILVVDDEPSIRALLTRLLQRLGYAVLSTGSPVEAVRVVAERGDEVDLLLTDVVMPEMNGRDLAQRVAELNPRVGCLFMSGYTSDVIASHGVLTPGVAFIAKPFTVQELGTKVREALDSN